ncbi:hypothetical protein ABZZ79_06375 [Streptomyces sp. NPDC006458]|uniref:hypothetical protein n=1 Tax=Streptomyces sp. NPDC006458 TaxID=3154302 RepID=UPI0033B88C10
MNLPRPASLRRRRLAAVLKYVLQLTKEGRYEEAEAEARACEAGARRLRRRASRLAVTWHAKAMATTLACAHGRGTEVLAEMEALIQELSGRTGSGRTLPLLVRCNRTSVLNSQGRHAEVEVEARDLLREVARLKHLTSVWKLELCVLDNLVDALCGLGRHEEAEAIARGNLPRAEGPTAAALHCGLVRSLNGQGRHGEALTEARRFTPEWDRALSGNLDLVTATALLGLGHRSEAEAAARRALADCEGHLHPAHPRLGEVRTLLERISADVPGGGTPQ